MHLLFTLLACEPDSTIIENHITACCCDDTGEATAPPDDTAAPPVDDPCADFQAPEAGAVETITDCIAEPDPITFSPEVEWRWAPTDEDHPYNQVMVSPVTGNLTDDNGDGAVSTDDTPDVAFTAYSGTDYNDSAGALVILSGSDGSELYYHTTLTHDGETYTPQSRGGVALADIDGDGTPEVCLPTQSAPLLCTHPDGTVVMVGEDPGPAYRNEWHASYPTIGDMDGDGSVEIAIGRLIWDSTGQLIGTGSSSHGGYVLANGVWFGAVSVMVDLDGDTELELVAGNAAYDRNGGLLWEAADADNGFAAVGDLDLDGAPEIVVTAAGSASVIDHSGNLLSSFALVNCSTGNTCGPPTIADFDADGEPEIGIAGVTSYTVYDDAQSGTWTPLWSQSIYDTSGATGAVVFDFEADGEAEVVFADEQSLHIWGGTDGGNRLGTSGWDPADHNSGTGMEFPTLADIDGDDSTEILLASNELFESGWFGVRAIGNGDGDPWMPSRPVWNQHAYSITNINDDLSIPTPVTENWQTHNNFRTQDQGEHPASWLPDLRVSDVTTCVDCDGGQSTIYVVVENQGMSDATADLIVTSDAGELVREVVVLSPQESLVLGPYPIANSDWQGSLQVDIDPDSSVAECHEHNNDFVLGMLPCEE